MFIFVHKCSHTAKIQSLFGDSAPARWTTPPRRSLRPFSGQRPWDVWVMARHIASHLITYDKAMSILQDTTSICVTMSMVESKFFLVGHSNMSLNVAMPQCLSRWAKACTLPIGTSFCALPLCLYHKVSSLAHSRVFLLCKSLLT